MSEQIKDYGLFIAFVVAMVLIGVTLIRMLIGAVALISTF